MNKKTIEDYRQEALLTVPKTRNHMKETIEGDLSRIEIYEEAHKRGLDDALEMFKCYMQAMCEKAQ